MPKVMRLDRTDLLPLFKPRRDNPPGCPDRQFALESHWAPHTNHCVAISLVISPEDAEGRRSVGGGRLHADLTIALSTAE
jgi:hypothetical protein